MKPKFSRASMVAALAVMLIGAGSAQAAGDSGHAGTVYVAHLTALNTNVTGTHTTGEARFTVRNGDLVIDMKVTGAPPDVVHWQHIHGFKDGHAASCATAADETDSDGILDVVETGKASGTTMVPLDNAPAAMDIVHGIYPKASANGSYTYHKVVPLKKLEAAFGKAFDGQKLDLDHRVVYIHGVASDTKLPSTVASLGSIPASVTLPIACGKIERVQ